MFSNCSRHSLSKKYLGFFFKCHGFQKEKQQVSFSRFWDEINLSWHLDLSKQQRTNWY